jgi:hypothetical protein
MITRKVFKQIAAAILPVKDRAQDIDELTTLARVVENIADVFAAANPKFDRKKFYEAAGFGMKFNDLAIAEEMRCPVCWGSGRLQEHMIDEHGTPTLGTIVNECYNCKGTGKVTIKWGNGIST